MPARLTVLASGSSGNAALLERDGFGLLIDCGLGPHELANRLALAGSSWTAVNAVILTHTHSDHWNAPTLAHIRRLNVPLFAHARHLDTLAARREYEPLRRAGLLVPYAPDREFELRPGLKCQPIAVPHDSDPTFAFRFDGPGWSLGYASDVGRPTDELAAAFAEVDVLALEYNHDVRMQRASRRPRILIDRVLGDFGHLSNVEAGHLTARIAAGGRLRAVVQLHLSRECNRPDLAVAAGRAAVATDAPAARIVTAPQFAVTKPVPLDPQSWAAIPVVRRSVQMLLPGLEPLVDR
ncbi:MAG: MBL fold metallo-hydrolase [Fimbriiglobus sp.]